MPTDPNTPVRLIFMPKPRRSRHPYQWSCMMGLAVYAVANLLLGPASHSPLLLVQDKSNNLLNWSLLCGSAFCLISIVVPDNLWRLVIEVSGHLLLITTAAMFASVAGVSFHQSRYDDHSGLSLNLVMFFCITVAAIGRTYEIGKTMRRTWFKPNTVGALVSVEDRTDNRVR